MFSCRYLGNLCVVGLGRVLNFLPAPAEVGFWGSSGWACAVTPIYPILVGLRKEGTQLGHSIQGALDTMGNSAEDYFSCYRDLG